MTKSLILAGGCFWCVEHDLREAPGVISVTSGYSGGASTSPTYENHEGHREVVLVEYNDSETSYKKLLQFFIDHIDPTDAGGQFADRGESYRTAIYYETEDEKLVAEAVIKELNQSHVYEVPAQVDIVGRKPFSYSKIDKADQRISELLDANCGWGTIVIGGTPPGGTHTRTAWARVRQSYSGAAFGLRLSKPKPFPKESRSSVWVLRLVALKRPTQNTVCR